MLSPRKLNKIRKEMTKSINLVLTKKREYTIEEVITSYAEEYGLKVAPLSDTSVILYEPGSDHVIQCDIVNVQGHGSIELTTRKSSTPLT